MFGRLLKTPLGKPLDVHVDYKEFERVCIEQKERQIEPIEQESQCEVSSGSVERSNSVGKSPN